MARPRSRPRSCPLPAPSTRRPSRTRQATRHSRSASRPSSRPGAIQLTPAPWSTSCDRSTTRDLMTIDSSGSHRTVHSGVHTALVGAQVLVIDADDRVHAGIQQLLSEVSLHVTSISDAERALEVANKQFFSVALVDIDTPSPRAGIQTIQAIKKASPTTMIIPMTPRRPYHDAA